MVKRTKPLSGVETTQGNAAGRVEFDSRGNSVWRWNAQGKDKLDSTSILIKRLENDALELEPTRSVRVRAGKSVKAPRRADLAVEDDAPDVGGGFDPYNHR
jgi:hypothetical protein